MSARLYRPAPQKSAPSMSRSVEDTVAPFSSDLRHRRIVRRLSYTSTSDVHKDVCCKVAYTVRRHPARRCACQAATASRSPLAITITASTQRVRRTHHLHDDDSDSHGALVEFPVLVPPRDRARPACGGTHPRRVGRFGSAQTCPRVRIGRACIRDRSSSNACVPICKPAAGKSTGTDKSQPRLQCRQTRQS